MPTQLSKQALRDRWRGDAQSLAREAATRLMMGSSLESLGLGRVDGRIDLRGLWLVNAARYLPCHRAPAFTDDLIPWAIGVHWADLDLSHTTLPIRLQRAHLENVRLDGAGLQSWYVCESLLEDVTLVGANLDQAVLDGNDGLPGARLQWPPTAWTRCDFSRAQMKNFAGFGRATLTDCLFVRSSWATGISGGHDFHGTNLIRCRFEGPSLALRFGWTGRLHDETPPWVEVFIPEDQASDCEANAISGPGIVLV